jgi:acyl-CoA reductase-like NAD-dependent aldehyde dehydrogenase
MYRENEAIRLANDSSFGLSAYVATTSVVRAQRMAQGSSAGAISALATNEPFSGGVHNAIEPHHRPLCCQVTDQPPSTANV